MPLATSIDVSLKARETEAADLGTSRLIHSLVQNLYYPTGAGASQLDVVYHASASAAAAADTYDVLGSLSSVLTGDAISFVTLCGIIVVNKSTTSTELLTIGAGSNPITGLWAASGDAIKIGPGGVFLWLDVQDGITPVAGTGDVLTIDPGADTISYDLALLGRSA